MPSVWRTIVSASKPVTFGDCGPGDGILELQSCYLLPMADGAVLASGTGPTLYCSADAGSTRLALARLTEDVPHCNVRANFSAKWGKLTLSVSGGGKVLIVGAVEKLGKSDEDQVPVKSDQADRDQAALQVKKKQLELVRKQLAEIEAFKAVGKRQERPTKRAKTVSEAIPSGPQVSNASKYTMGAWIEKATKRESGTFSLPASHPNAQMDLALSRPQEVKQKKKKTGPQVEDRQELPSGIDFQVVRPGKGKVASDGDVLQVKYEGRLANSGKRFDKGTIKFRLGGGKMIRGWDIGMKGMVKGEKRKLWIPARLGYGAKGAPPEIPCNADLEFDVELLAIPS